MIRGRNSCLPGRQRQRQRQSESGTIRVCRSGTRTRVLGWERARIVRRMTKWTDGSGNAEEGETGQALRRAARKEDR